ncbi:uncharacterized protein CIMG_12878 [Coccidioides immitis RS]|uniref:Uncharacterized protein n=1 Tax=Coccidioides immitis (strain RS) TaxID=246410 RepID=J3KGX3_COCIM|nr:uncharacterized protein CIMG_12878 [Coccidioides immitis RS]EAS35040.3 hypothetical protein CIMG_12878 [Coccidioides immitis RS]
MLGILPGSLQDNRRRPWSNQYGESHTQNSAQALPLICSHRPGGQRESADAALAMGDNNDACLCKIDDPDHVKFRSNLNELTAQNPK